MKRELEKQCAVVLLKVALFFLVYLLLVAAGLAIVAAVCLWSWRANVFGTLLNASTFWEWIAGIFLSLCYVLVAGFLVLYGLYPLKFMFRKGSRRCERMIETSEDENPRLFAVIRSVAQSTGNKMPLHVYVSPDVNASVFYDSLWRSILFPTRKNLVVGLGLCINSSAAELKAVLAHEFGHFAQQTMRVGSLIYYANMVMYGMAFQEDRWDECMNKWAKLITDVGRYNWYGVIAIIVMAVLLYILAFAKNTLQWMYRFVNRSYRSLSRQMEYDADRVACDVAGSGTFASALIKTDFAGNCTHDAQVVWNRILSSGHYAPLHDTFVAYEQVKAEELGTTISNGIEERDPSKFVELHSLISFSNVFSDHPSTVERVTAMGNLPPASNGSSDEAISLFDRKTVEAVEALFYDSFSMEKPYADAKSQPVITADKVKEWIKEDYEGECLPVYYRPFFMYTSVFNIDCSVPDGASDPFTETNRKTYIDYASAINDYKTLLSLSQQNEVKYIAYRDRRYSINELPIEEHRLWLDNLHAKCVEIDKQIFAFLVANVPDGCNVHSYYELLFESIDVRNELQSLDRQVDEIRARLQSPRDDDDEFDDVKLRVRALHKDLNAIVDKCSVRLFGACIGIGVDENYLRQLVASLQVETPDIFHDISVVVDFANYLLQRKQVLDRLMLSLHRRIQRVIANIAIAIEDDKTSV